VSTSLPMPIRRGSTLFLALALALGALLPLAAPTTTRAAPTELFFSEYIEGSSNNKALEIYNGTGATVDLAAGDYEIWQYSNGASTTSLMIDLTGSVAAGDVYVFAHSLANAAILAQADQHANLGLFNGDDAVVLMKADVAIDVIGQIGFRPNPEWGSGLTSTENNTLARKDCVEAGDPDGSNAFDPAVQWNGFATDTFTGLGAHSVSGLPCPTPPTGTGSADPSSVPAGASTTLSVVVTPGSNPSSTGVTVSADLSAIGGSATQAFTESPAAGTFTFVATVAADTPGGTYQLPVTVRDAQGRSSSTTITLEVLGEAIRIADIQGAGHLSEMDGDAVFDVEGIVTAVSGNGFWMTDPEPDGDDATSDGIFVFRGSSGSKPAVGQHVVVDGTVDEFRPGGSGGFENLTTTEIVNSAFEILSSGNALPTIVIGQDRVPPTTIIEDDATASVEAEGVLFDPEEDGLDFWESLEGMRLQVADAVAVGPRNNFGEIAVISQLQTDAGFRTPRGGIIVRNLTGTGDYVPGDFNPERLIIDDALSATPFVNVGDEFATDPVGVLDYSFGAPKLFLTADPGRVDNGLVREATTPQGPQDLAVATYNVENLSVVNPQAKFDELANQIVQHLQAPDIIGIEEMQDDSGPANNGAVSADAGWQRLIDAIVDAGGPQYQFRSIDPVNNADGGQPGGNIRVGFLYREDRGVVFVDRSVEGADPAITDTDVDPTPNGKGAQLTMSPGRVLQTPEGMESAFDDTRKSLAGEFKFRGETVFVVVNHLSSKGDDRPLSGHFQPPFRLTEFESGTPEDGWRHAQAQTINNFVDEILAVDGDAHVIVLGDINDFDFSETVEVLTGERLALDPGPFLPDENGSGPTAPSGEAPVLTTLFELLADPTERYSYVFEGNSQVLDQILVSDSLWDLGVTYDVVHVNAEFADQASDHDPSVMKVAFQPRR
jgi:predicted extracellular nuclease